MDEHKFRQLIQSYQDGTATPDEKKAVEAFFESYRKDDKDWPYEIMGDPEETKKQIFEKILQKHSVDYPGAEVEHRALREETSVPDENSGAHSDSYRSSSVPWFTTPLKIAATLLILILAGYGAYVYKYQNNDTQVNDFIAGGDKATLQLADGTTIELDSTGTVVIPQQGLSTVRNEDGKLAYISDNPGADSDSYRSTSEPVAYNTITTPRGGQYNLILADGSQVWLNAASSLRFPAAFTGKERIVELTGEAYFEIAKNEQMPFKVRILPPLGGTDRAPGRSEGAEVTVLGTHFNVMAYEEEQIIKTTLLEGAVAFSPLQGGRGLPAEASAQAGVTLKPNQQAQLSTTGTISVISDYDITEAVAWKNGKFIFNDTELENIMRQVSRWYDVEVTYEDDLRALQFGGVVSRRENASAVLNLLELTQAVYFEIRGRKIIVKSVNK